MYGSCLSVVLHSLRDDRAMGVEQVSIFMVVIMASSLTPLTAGTGFIAPTTTSMHHVGSKY